jgi:hypothetical protein
MPSVYSVGVGGGGPDWQRGLDNIQKFLGGLEARKQRRRQDEAKRQQEEAKRKQEEADRREKSMSRVAWTVGTLPAAAMMGAMPGAGALLGPLAGIGMGMGGLAQMLLGRSQQQGPGHNAPGAGGAAGMKRLAKLLGDPRLAPLLRGPMKGQAGFSCLPMLLRALGGTPSGIGLYGRSQRGAQPPYGPFKIAV